MDRVGRFFIYLFFGKIIHLFNLENLSNKPQKLNVKGELYLSRGTWRAALEPLPDSRLFNIFLKDVEACINSLLTVFTVNTEAGTMVNKRTGPSHKELWNRP